MSQPTGTRNEFVRQRAYIGLDQASEQTLRKVKPIILEALPDILRRFYERTAAEPVLAAKFTTPERMSFAREAQTRHWSRLFDGKFDEDLHDSALRVGTAHHKIDLSPRWYLSGYAFVLGEVLATLAEQQKGLLNTPTSRAELAQSLRSVSRAILLDMDMAMGAYWDTLAERRDQAVGSMIARIDQQVMDTVESVGDLTRELVSSAETVATVTRSVSQNTGGASGAANEALTSAQTVAAAAEELHASINEIGSQVTRSADAAHEAATRMDEARSVVNRLGQAAEEIGRVVEIIGSIAAQTNMLALNATIEAARAGDAGRGFAVVAGEVKSLANQSASSANEINARVSTIQQVTTDTVNLIDRVSEAIQRMEEVANGIAAAVDEQTAATSEIARNVAVTASRAEEVDHLMVSVSGSVNQADSAASAVRANARRMNEAMGTMRQLLGKAVRSSAAIADGKGEHRHACLIDLELRPRGSAVRKAVLYDVGAGGALMFDIAGTAVGTMLDLHLHEMTGAIQAKVVQGSGDLYQLSFANDQISADKAKSLSSSSIGRLVQVTTEDHVAFVDRLRQAASKAITIQPDDLSTHHSCRLGRWYDSVTDDEMLALDAFRNLMEPHRAVHGAGRALLKSLAEGDSTGAATHMAEAEGASRRVIELLAQLGSEYRKL